MDKNYLILNRTLRIAFRVVTKGRNIVVCEIILSSFLCAILRVLNALIVTAGVMMVYVTINHKCVKLGTNK